MKAGTKALLVLTSSAVAAALLVVTLGGAPTVRAADSETLAAPAQEMVLVSAKSLEAMEKRIAYLEEAVNSLTESWQHIDTHRLCVGDDSGAETCLTKAQLDALLIQQAYRAEAARPAALVDDAGKVAEPEPAAVKTAESPEPPAGAVSNEVPQEEPEHTGSIAAVATTEQGVLSPPEVITPEIAAPGDLP
jgi:hypothetical protein